MSTMAQSLEDMAEELTCSICLCLFTTPVTIPCGHNFCSQCLELTWKGDDVGQYNCPQCRYHFTTKPDLMKNTSLSNLVSRIMDAQSDSLSGGKEDVVVEEVEDEDKKESVLCDHCMKMAAAKTCLTCMASFCIEHLQPHLESPAFRDHHLRQPMRDLQLRKCSEHTKLLDSYCWDHAACICCYCLVSHKQCRTHSLQIGKMQKEVDMKKLLQTLTQKINKASSTIEDIKGDQRKIMDNTKRKKDLLEGEFDEIKALIEGHQEQAMRKIEEEEKKVNSKFGFTQSVLKKKQLEYEAMRRKVESLLQEEDDIEFLKRAAKIHDTTSKEPYKPKTEFDEKLLHQIYRSTVLLKEAIKTKLQQPGELMKYQIASIQEKRQERVKNPNMTMNQQNGNRDLHHSQRVKQTLINQPQKDIDLVLQIFEATVAKIKSPLFLCGSGNTIENLPSIDKQRYKSYEKKSKAKNKPAAVSNPSREELLKYAEQLIVDLNTAHKRLVLSDRCTKLTVSDKPQGYRDNPERFTHCSQALCSTGFSHGLHYWEIDIQGGNFSGIGIAYKSMARAGSDSRLGRNKTSWCIEWFNGKLQAWHDDKQTDLTTPNSNKIGVLLNYDEGFLSFFSVAKKFSQIYRFHARFTETIYPAFWVFSSNTTLCISSFN
ncbi:E3 ubiquitin/ISG15 ligase TRIM25 [Pelodytes ibericus]